MAKITVYECDRQCGEITSDKHKMFKIDVPYYDGSGERKVCPVEVCEECFDSWRELMTDYFAAIVKTEDSFTVKSRESAKECIEGLQMDIEELEEELERLRDTKDTLFTTNFLLTEKLREVGVEID